MGQIREYKGPQSAFRPDAKKIKLDGGRTQPSTDPPDPLERHMEGERHMGGGGRAYGRGEACGRGEDIWEGRGA